MPIASWLLNGIDEIDNATGVLEATAARRWSQASSRCRQRKQDRPVINTDGQLRSGMCHRPARYQSTVLHYRSPAGRALQVSDRVGGLTQSAGRGFAGLRMSATLLSAENAGIPAQARSQVDWHAPHGYCSVARRLGVIDALLSRCPARDSAREQRVGHGSTAMRKPWLARRRVGSPR